MAKRYHDKRLMVSLTKAQWDALEDVRHAHRLGSAGAAVRMMVEKGLEDFAKGFLRPPSQKVADPDSVPLRPAAVNHAPQVPTSSQVPPLMVGNRLTAANPTFDDVPFGRQAPPPGSMLKAKRGAR